MDGNDTPPTCVGHVNDHEWKTPDGKRHRGNDKPAFILPGKVRSWWVDGKLHRGDDKPAIMYANGSREWFVNDQLHRGNDKPAAFWAGGSVSWWVNGAQHRGNDKPAVWYSDGFCEWWVHDTLIGRGSATDFTNDSLRFGFLTAVCGHVL